MADKIQINILYVAKLKNEWLIQQFKCGSKIKCPVGDPIECLRNGIQSDTAKQRMRIQAPKIVPKCNGPKKPGVVQWRTVGLQEYNVMWSILPKTQNLPQNGNVPTSLTS